MENSIICRGGSAMSNSIIQRNKAYFNTRPLFEAIKFLIFFKIFHNFGQIGGWGSDHIFFIFSYEGFPYLLQKFVFLLSNTRALSKKNKSLFRQNLGTIKDG